MIPTLSLREAAATLSKASVARIPPPRGTIRNPNDFLTAIGRSSATKLSSVAAGWKWEDMWTISGDKLKEAGVPVRDRKYVLWSMEKYRLGGDPTLFAIPPTPKKKIRGWGPRVQHGKRVR